MGMAFIPPADMGYTSNSTYDVLRAYNEYVDNHGASKALDLSNVTRGP